MKLNENFNQQEFIDWISNFLTDFSKDIRKVDVSKSFQGIKSIQTIGESSLGVRVYIIETEQDPSRRKVSLAKESFTLLRDYGTPNAIIAYHSNDFAFWRLSLLTSTLSWDEGRINKKLSNPKRQSYILGSKAKVKTPHQYLIAKGSVVDLKELKSRFSLEVVNKEFYKEISHSFIDLVGGTLTKGKSKEVVKPKLKLPSVSDHSQTAQEFVVRLIGRVIFSWFLREKKSSAGHSLMPHDLLSLDAARSAGDYYHTILEPIFFEVLNKKINSRKETYTVKPFSDIPYLNGGLFAPHDDDHYSYNEGKQAINHSLVVIPDSWFVSFFEILETYNFTIDENTSFDEELSIDPEMLGRIFENLLAEINPETGESARKSTGSYYTPRVIVDYMVDESLYLYLKDKTGITENKLRPVISYDLDDDSVNPLTDEERDKITQALQSVKILDPACGSGAFPIGALQKIVYILQQIDPHGQIWFNKQIQNTSIELRRLIQKEFEEKNFDYLRKLGVIRENIYGVDIQPIATEISRLRCFLTLVVDQRVDDSLSNRGIEPLPNLDFKFVTANTLLGMPQQKLISGAVQQDLFDSNQSTKIEELRHIKDSYFSCSDAIEKSELKSEFRRIQNDLWSSMHQMNAFGQQSLALSGWDPFSHKPTDWFDPDWMFGIKDGFDVVIANPPYIRHRDLDIGLKEYLKTHFSTGNQTSDIYCYFIEIAYNLLTNTGISCYITSNKWLKAKYGQNIRLLLKSKTSIFQLIDLGGNQFESATVDTSILLFSKQHNPENIIKYSNSMPTSSLTMETIQQSEINVNAYNLANKEHYLLKIKVEKAGLPLKDWKSIKINYGVLTGKNKTVINGIEEGVFIINGEKRAELIKQDNSSEELIRPILKGKDINRYYANWDNKYLICMNYGIHTMIEKYPAIQSHLYRFKDLLESRAQVIRGDHHWLELDQNPSSSFMHEFTKEKIIFPIISQEPKFHLDKNQYFHNDKAFHIIGENLSYLTAILNSKMAYWIVKLYGPLLGNRGFEFRKIFVEQIPIPFLSAKDQEPIVKLVNQIYILTKKSGYNPKNPPREQKELENHIDQLVYKLYGLTEKEISIVEDSYCE